MKLAIGTEAFRKVFVSGLPFSVDWLQLKAHFQAAGPVGYAKVLMDRDTGQSRGFGVVEFDSMESTSVAIDLFNGSQLMGRTLSVRHDTSSSQQDARPADNLPSKRIADGMGSMPGNMFGMGSMQGMSAGYGAYGNAMGMPGFGGMGHMGAGDGGYGGSSGMGGMDMYGMPTGQASGMRPDFGNGGYGSMGADFGGGGYGGMGGFGMGGGGMYGMGGMGNSMGMAGMGMAGMGMGMAGIGGMGSMGTGMGGMGGAFNGGMAMGDSGEPSARLFISNLSYDTTWQRLKDHFKACGRVAYCTIIKDKLTERSKGFGVVEYESPMDAMTAIAQLQNSNLDGRNIFVREDQKDPGPQPLNQAAMGRQQQPMGGPMMGGMAAMGGWGGGGGGGFGGPAMGMGADVGMAGNGVSGPTRSSRGSEWGNSSTMGIEKRECQVVVHGIPFAFDAPQLVELASAAGNVLHARIPADDIGRSRGWGTVLFDSPEGAQAAIASFNRMELNGRTLSVKVDEKA